MTIHLDTPAARTWSAMRGVEAGLAELRAALADSGVREICHDELTELVVAARRAGAQLEATVATAVGEVDARGSHVHEGALTAQAWLRRHARMTPAEATATVRTARELRSGKLPLTAEAFADGEISARHAQVIATRVADAPEGAAALIEPFAVEAARQADVSAVSGVMRQFQHALDRDRADEEAIRRLERRGFTIVPTLDGSMAIRGNADDASGAVIATAVDAASPLVKDDRRSAAQRRLDGLAEICRRFLASADAPATGGGGHPHVIVTTDDDTLRSAAAQGGSTQPSPGAMLSWVGHIAATTAQRIACDANVTVARIGADGEIVDSTTERRFFTAAQRRAMIARDGDRCVWPWCDRPIAWSDGHHLRSWADGGPTTVVNGALPCEGHHVMVHEGKWVLDRLPDGRYLVRHPDGRTVGPEPYPPGHNRPVPHRRE